MATTIIKSGDSDNQAEVTNDNALKVTVSGAIVTDPDVNIHDSTGASLSSTTGALNTFLTNSSIAVTGPLTDTQLRATAVPISAASLPLPSGASTEAKQDTGNTSLASIDSKLTSPITITGTVTANQGTSPWVVSATIPGTVTVNQGTSPWVTSASQSGTWNINNISGTISLPTGASTSALQTTANTSLSSIDSKLTSPITVTGPLTDTQLRATAVPVSGTLTVTGSGNFTVVQPTGTNLHTVIDSGTVAATQSGSWTTGRTWTLSSGTDSVATTISGTVAVTQSGTWSTRLQDGSGNAITSQVNGSQRALDVGVNVAGVQVDPRAASPGTLTDRSGTATGTSAQMMAANSSRKFLFIQAGAKGIWFNFTTTAVAASPSIFLAPNSSFMLEGSYISTEAINVIRDSANIAYTAKEG